MSDVAARQAASSFVVGSESLQSPCMVQDRIRSSNMTELTNSEMTYSAYTHSFINKSR